MVDAFILGTLGELILVEIFVFYIWLKVLIDAVKNREPGIVHKRLLMTSLGLVLNAVAIGGIIMIRVQQLVSGDWPFIWEVVVFYVILALANFMFILSAALGTNAKILKIFIGTTVIWTAVVFIANFWG